MYPTYMNEVGLGVVLPAEAAERGWNSAQKAKAILRGFGVCLPIIISLFGEKIPEGWMGRSWVYRPLHGPWRDSFTNAFCEKGGVFVLRSDTREDAEAKLRQLLTGWQLPEGIADGNLRPGARALLIIGPNGSGKSTAARALKGSGTQWPILDSLEGQMDDCQLNWLALHLRRWLFGSKGRAVITSHCFWDEWEDQLSPCYPEEECGDVILQKLGLQGEQVGLWKMKNFFRSYTWRILGEPFPKGFFAPESASPAYLPPASDRSLAEEAESDEILARLLPFQEPQC